MACRLVDHTRRNPWRCHVDRSDLVVAMSVRDAIADRLWGWGLWNKNEGADAIIDAIKKNVPPLVFHDPRHQASFAEGVTETYAYQPSHSGTGYTLRIKGGEKLGDYETQEEAIAAAQAHQVERLMKGLGL